MDEQLDELESQIDAELGEFSRELNELPGPGLAVRERVKLAVRHEMNERWLAAQEPVPPRLGLLHEVKRRVRCELVRTGAMSRARLFVESRMMGGLVAAALLLVCVGLIWQIGYLGSTEPGSASALNLASANSNLDLFVEAAQVVWDSEERQEQTDASVLGSAPDSLMEDLTGALEDVLESPQAADDSTNGGVPREGGAVG